MTHTGFSRQPSVATSHRDAVSERSVSRPRSTTVSLVDATMANIRRAVSNDPSLAAPFAAAMRQWLNEHDPSQRSTRAATHNTQKSKATPHSTASASVVSSSTTVAASWSKLFANQCTSAIRTLSSLTALERIRIECLVNLCSVATQAAVDLSHATLGPDHPFVRSANLVLPVVAFQLKASSVPISKLALEVIEVLSGVLGSLLLPAVKTTLHHILAAWVAPHHLPLLVEFERCMEAVVGLVTDASDVFSELEAFFEAPNTPLPQRHAVARLSLRLMEATVASNPCIMRLHYVIVPLRVVSRDPYILPLGMLPSELRRSIARSKGVSDDDVRLVTSGSLALGLEEHVTDASLLTSGSSHPFQKAPSTVHGGAVGVQQPPDFATTQRPSAFTEHGYRISIKRLWQMWCMLVQCPAYFLECGETFRALYVLFPHEVTELFNERFAGAPVAERAELERLITKSRWHTVIFTPLHLHEGHLGGSADGDDDRQSPILLLDDGNAEVPMDSSMYHRPKRRTLVTQSSSGRTVLITSRASTIDISSVADLGGTSAVDDASPVSHRRRSSRSRSPEHGGRPPLARLPNISIASEASSSENRHSYPHAKTAALMAARLADITRKRSNTSFSFGTSSDTLGAADSPPTSGTASAGVQ